MHKIFAKTIFLGKNVVFLPHCHSTNEVAKELAKSGKLKNGSLVWADYQEKGKGQQGNVWLSETGKNLLFTLLLKPEDMKPTEQFQLNMAVSVGLQAAVKQWLPSEKIEIKWPNDLYVNDQKAAGILIETNITSSRIETVFCGIGLNVNQLHFALPTATSLAIEKQSVLNRDEVLESVLIHLEKALELLAYQPQQLLAVYEKNMRWKGEEHQFQVGERLRNGTLLGVSSDGKLRVRFGEGEEKFNFKEIVFVA